MARRGDRCDLYHSALQVYVPEGRFVIEQAPAWSEAAERGVVAEGSVGARAAGRLRLFRYQIRRRRDGIIPDVEEAVESPLRLSDDPARAGGYSNSARGADARLGPRRTGAGAMWNSNSTISWLLARSGLDVESIRAPPRRSSPGLEGRDRDRAPPASTTR